MNWNITNDSPEPVSVRLDYGQYRFSICYIEPYEDQYKWMSIDLPRGIWDKSTIIDLLIRMKYSSSQVEAILNNVLSDPFDEQYKNEYLLLQEWRKTAKEYATYLMNWADEHELGNLVQSTSQEEPETKQKSLNPDGVEMLMQAVALLKSQVTDLDDEKAKDVPALFPTWQDKLGQIVEVGERLYYDGKLWKVLQTHMVQSSWTPDVAASLFTQVGAVTPEMGTADNPIPYEGNMILEEGKYYSQYNVVYICIRDSINPVYHDLSALVGLYVNVVS